MGGPQTSLCPGHCCILGLPWNVDFSVVFSTPGPLRISARVQESAPSWSSWKEQESIRGPVVTVRVGLPKQPGQGTVMLKMRIPTGKDKGKETGPSAFPHVQLSGGQAFGLTFHSRLLLSLTQPPNLIPK